MSWVPNDDRFNFSLIFYLEFACLACNTLRVHMKYMYECGGMHEPGDQMIYSKESNTYYGGETRRICVELDVM